MTFEKIKTPIPDMDAWGCKVGVTSYCVSFDRLHPAFGYRISRQIEGFQTEYIERPFKTLKQAKKACEAMVN